MKLKIKSIDWKSGNAVVMIGLGIVISAFLLIILLFQQYQMFNDSVTNQMITDVIIDGSSAYGQDMLGINEPKFNSMADLLIAENESVTNSKFEIVRDKTTFENTQSFTKSELKELGIQSRKDYNDTIVTLTIKGTPSESYSVTSSATSVVFAFMNTNIEVTADELTIIGYFMSKLPPNSVQYKAFKEVLEGEYMHHMYGGNAKYASIFPQRTGKDTYDCSGFVSSAYTRGAKISLGWGTTSGIPGAKGYRGNSSLTGIKTGDVLSYKGHTAIYLGVVTEELKSMLSPKAQGRLSVGRALEIDAAHNSRALLPTSPAGGSDGYGTNWGIQIRYQGTSNNKRQGYIDMDVYNQEADKVLGYMAAPTLTNDNTNNSDTSD